jgi:hypothetical protein
VAWEHKELGRPAGGALRQLRDREFLDGLVTQRAGVGVLEPAHEAVAVEQMAARGDFRVRHAIVARCAGNSVDVTLLPHAYHGRASRSQNRAEVQHDCPRPANVLC